jgi:hypothetical protein
MLILLLYGLLFDLSESQLTSDQIKSEVDLTDLDSIDDPEVMKKYLPRLEAALVTKTDEINEYVVDQIREIGMCSKISCIACLRLGLIFLMIIH